MSPLGIPWRTWVTLHPRDFYRCLATLSILSFARIILAVTWAPCYMWSVCLSVFFSDCLVSFLFSLSLVLVNLDLLSVCFLSWNFILEYFVSRCALCLECFFRHSAYQNRFFTSARHHTLCTKALVLWNRLEAVNLACSVIEENLSPILRCVHILFNRW